jgi:hypothetical protein
MIADQTATITATAEATADTYSDVIPWRLALTGAAIRLALPEKLAALGIWKAGPGLWSNPYPRTFRLLSSDQTVATIIVARQSGGSHFF